jgi:transposase
MGKQRKHYTPEQKVTILRRHLIDKVPVSDLCNELHLQPTVFYRWLKEFFENGATAFRHASDSESKRDKERIAALEAKLKSKNEVVSELMEEHMALKKSLGEI